MGKIKILIADDYAVVREGTRQILEREPDLDVVAEAVVIRGYNLQRLSA